MKLCMFGKLLYITMKYTWGEVTSQYIICGHITISVLWGNKGYCVKLSGKDLSRCWNKIQLVYENDRIISSVTVTNISASLPHNMTGKQLA